MRSKKLFLIVLISLLYLIPVKAEESVIIDNLKVIKSSDGVVLNANDKVAATFNDLNQQVKYEVIIKNPTSKKLYLNFLEVENKSEKFMEYKLDSKSENMALEPNESSKAIFYINTLEIEGAGRNLDDNVKINFIVSDKIFNPNTFSNIFDLIILLLILGSTMYFVRKNKKVKTLVLIIGISIISINYVSANDYIKAQLSGNIKYTSQNNIITTGTTLNNKKADYTNSKEVWAYYDKVKNIEVKSLLNEPKKYYKKFDLTENKTGRVMAYLTENNDKDTPYDLTIMSQGVVIANPDASFMFSFPNTEKVEGLSNVDFRNTTTMQGMFIGNEKLEKIDTEAIELKSTIDTSYMFYDCEEIEHGRSDFNLENVTNTTMMFTPYLYNEVKDGAKVETDEVFLKSPSETNLRGNFIRKDTLEDEYPIYYYRGAVTNNNVKFAGFCWQIVRTTETGGVKLVYNGTPNTDGTCKGPGEDTIIGNSTFNGENRSYPSAGYMINDTSYNKKTRVEKDVSTLFYNYDYLTNDLNEYYYSKKIKYENGQYTLIDPIKRVWKDSYEELNGYYSCKKTTLEGCSKIRQIVNPSQYNQNYYEYSNGNTNETEFHILGKDYEINEDGTYTLKDVIKLTNMDWSKQSKELSENNLYGCSGLKSETCEKLNYISITNYIGGYIEEIISDTIYASDVEYKDGKYILKDTYKSISWYKDKEQLLTKYNYTCLNENDECETLYYNIDSSNIYNSDYLIFTNGEKVNDFIENIFKNDKDSTIKDVIDNWYETNLLNYESKIEDTVWCNNRKIVDGTLVANSTIYDSNQFEPSINASSKVPYINLNCEQKNDAFTVDVKNGNGALKYPIGLITVDEGFLSGYGNKNYNYLGESYLTNPSSTIKFYTISPSSMGNTGEAIIYGFTGQGLIGTQVSLSRGVRPSISLKNKIKYETGNGTKEKPYVIE